MGMSMSHVACPEDHYLASTQQTQMQLFCRLVREGPTSGMSTLQALRHALWRLLCSGKLIWTICDRRACQNILHAHELKMVSMMPQPRARPLCKHTGTK